MAPPSALPTLADIARAREFLKEHLPATRIAPAPSLTAAAGAPVYLKLESDLPTGSFKVRGALYALWSRLQEGPVSEVVASSTGNHGAAVAFAAKRLGVGATIVLPRGANPVKRRRIAELGATIVEHGTDISEAAAAAAERARQPGVFFLNDATDRALPAGPATIGREIVEQVPDVGEIYVPVGDSALIRGIAAGARAIRPNVRLIGVQAERAPSYYLSWREGRVVTTETCDTIADGLATRTPVAANVAAMREAVDEVRLVTEAGMLAAVARLALDEHVIAEPSAAAPLAALRPGSTQQSPIVLVITGANIAPDVLRKAICGDGT